MKTLLLAISILISSQLLAVRWYVSGSGSSDSYAGTRIAPFATLTKAASSQQGNDTIVVNGTVTNYITVHFKITANLMADEFNGGTVICLANSTNINYYSATAAEGGFSISGITFDGQNSGYGAIMISRLHNPTVKNCIIKDFIDGGLDFRNPDGGAPNITGLKCINNIITNCTGYLAPGSYGNLWITGQKNAIVSGCKVTASFRAGDNAGFAVKTSHTENIKFFDCEFIVVGHDDGPKWCFAMENNHVFGGMEIYNCRIQGVIDFAGTNCIKGIYAYSVYVHDCVIGHDSQSSRYQYGIFLEVTGGIMEDVYITDNEFKNLTAVLQFYNASSETTKRIYFLNNLCYEIGQITGSGVGWGIMQSGASTTATLRDVYIDNNVFKAMATGSQIAAIRLPYRIATRNYNARNNIIMGFENAPIITDGGVLTGTVDTLRLQNNLIYQNGNSNNVQWYGIQPTNIVNTGTLKVDPLFVSSTDYRLSALSPAIDAGIYVGLNYIGSAPDIGAFEYYLNSNKSLFNNNNSMYQGGTQIIY
jgi:hypothetical protein